MNTPTGQRRFRFGAVAGFGRSGQEWAANARHIEQLGFSTLLCPDGTGTFAPFQALSAAAAVTGTLRLGTYVLASPLRTPGDVAWESASLDVLSGGRFELGLGAGRPDAERDAARQANASTASSRRCKRCALASPGRTRRPVTTPSEACSSRSRRCLSPATGRGCWTSPRGRRTRWRLACRRVVPRTIWRRRPIRSV